MTINASQAWVFAALSELSYRRAPTDFALDLTGINAGRAGLQNPFGEGEVDVSTAE
jgi:hypothetical protein